MFGIGTVPKEIHFRISNPVSHQNKTCTWKGSYGRHWYVWKKPLWERIYGITQKYEFLPFLFSFLITNFHNFSYIFSLHHCSAIFWYFLRLIYFHVHYIFHYILYTFRLRQWSIWNCCNVWKGAFYDNHLRIPVVAFCNRGICLVCFSSPRSASSFVFFSVNNIIVCSEVSFSWVLTRIGWCLYNKGGFWKIFLNRL